MSTSGSRGVSVKTAVISHHLSCYRSTSGSRGLSVNPAMISHHLQKMDPGKMSASTKGADLPISEDVIRSITTFCFPGQCVCVYI